MLSSTRQTLKKRAHSLKPVVQIGQKGLTDAVLKEIGVALLAHELIKINVVAEDKAARQDILQKICDHHQAECIQSIGHIGVVFKQRPQE